MNLNRLDSSINKNQYVHDSQKLDRDLFSETIAKEEMHMGPPDNTSPKQTFKSKTPIGQSNTLGKYKKCQKIFANESEIKKEHSLVVEDACLLEDNNAGGGGGGHSVCGRKL